MGAAGRESICSYVFLLQVSQKEVVVGWYSSGPRIKPSDLAINEIFRR